MDQNNIFYTFENSFWELSRKTEQLWKQIFTHTFPGSQSKIVYLLKQKGPLNMSEIANNLELTAGAVTTASNHLIEHDYVERIPSESDRRVIQLQLTLKGLETLKQLQIDGHKKMRHVFQHLDEEQLHELEKLFKIAINHLNTM